MRLHASLRKKHVSRSCMCAPFIWVPSSLSSPSPRQIAQHAYYDWFALKCAHAAEKGMHTARSAGLRAAAVCATGKGAGRTISSVGQGAYLKTTRQERAPLGGRGEQGPPIRTSDQAIWAKNEWFSSIVILHCVYIRRSNHTAISNRNSKTLFKLLQYGILKCTSQHLRSDARR